MFNENPMLMLNVSNHPSSGWSKKQRDGYHVVDIPFPEVRTTQDGAVLAAQQIVEAVKAVESIHKPTVHLMGELGACVIAATQLHSMGYDVVHSMTKRISVMGEDGVKHSKFEFAGFRDYFPTMCSCGRVATIGAVCDDCFGRDD